MTISKAQQKATNNYKRRNYKRIGLEVKKEYFEDVLKPAADHAGQSVNGYIKEAIAEKIEREKPPEK